MIQALTWAATLAGFASTYLLGRKCRAGWVISIAGTALWVAANILLGISAGVVQGVVNVGLSAWNYSRWNSSAPLRAGGESSPARSAAIRSGFWPVEARDRQDVSEVEVSQRPGDFGVVATHGFVAWVIRKLTKSSVNHAFVYVGDGQIVEAQPGGARLSPATDYQSAVWSHFPLSQVEQERIVQAAKACIGVPYSFLDIVALCISILCEQKTPRFIAKRLSRPDRLICSQLVDQCYLSAGLHLFQDGKLPSEVTPADLLALIRKEG